MSKILAIVSIISLLLISIQSFAEVDDNYDNKLLVEDSFELDPELDNNLLSNVPTTFTVNAGQLENEEVRFYDQGGSVWFTDDGVWFELREYSEPGDQCDGMLFKQPEPLKYKRHVIKQEFVGVNSVTPIGIERISWNSNFFYGNDSGKWRTSVPNYQEIWYENLYDKIDLRYYTNKDGLKYDFIVHPGGSVEDICIQYKGAEVTNDVSNIFIKTPIGSIRDGKLCVYQIMNEKRIPVQARFSTTNNFVRYRVNYNPRYTLVIDPLIYSSFLGGGGANSEYGRGIDVDDFGCAYATGYTPASDFPTTPGAYDTNVNGLDIFVTKFNQAGSKLLFSTFVGGTGQEYADGIAVDSAGNSYVAGQTRSNNYPTTPGAYDRTYGGSYDVFVFKLNSSGSGLVYSTYVGGSQVDDGNAIAVDDNGCAYVTGETRGNFPTSINAFDKTHDGNGDVFVFKVNQNGTDLAYSTYVSNGNDYAMGFGICVNSYGSAFITGYTRESNFYTTSGVYDTSINGGSDIFVTKMNHNGSNLHYSTFMGSFGDESGWDITVDNYNNTYVTGGTLSPTFPTTADAYDPTDNPKGDIFVFKLKHDASNILYSTYVGGSEEDYGRGITIDDFGNAYVTGTTDSSDFPTTPKAYDKIYAGWSEAVFFNLNHNGSDLFYSSYLGGSKSDQGWDIAMDSQLNLYLVGLTTSNDFANTTGANDTTYDGQTDVFVSKFRINDIFNITSVSLLKNDVSTSKIYARNDYYTFRIKFFHNVNKTHLGVVELHLDSGINDIRLQWDSSTGDFSEIYDPNDLITIDNSSTASNFYALWTVDFNIIFNWVYPHEDLNDIQIYATSTKLPNTWFNVSEFFQVENDLVFSGSLVVYGEDDRIIKQNDLVRGSEILNWTGLYVVYEDTDDLYPNSEEYNITVWDENFDYWSESPIEGKECDVTTITYNLTNKDGYVYRINISGIPPQCDKTDVTFTIRIDGDNVSYSNPTPSYNTWQKNNNVLAGITISDHGGGAVDGSTIFRAVSINNGSSWTKWENAKESGLAKIVTVQNQVKLKDGTENLVKWQANDSLGNGPHESQAYRIKVDTEEVFYSDFWPFTNEVSKTEEVHTGITISDSTSGVDASSIEYSISTNDGSDWGSWVKVNGYSDGLEIKIDINITFLNGTKNRLRWRASDVAGNGPMESHPYPILVDTWAPQVKPNVILLSPPNGMSLNKSSIKLSWELENTTIENVVYDLYFDNITPPQLYEKGIQNLNYTIDNLKDGEIYYWRVIPKHNDNDGTCLSGIFWFKVELPVEGKNYALSITGQDNISMYPGENKSIELRIKNIGSHEDIIRLDLLAGELSRYVHLDDYSILTLAKNSEEKRSLRISLPKSVQSGNHTIIITAISMKSSELITVIHKIDIEIKKLVDEDNGKQNGTPKISESESEDLLLIIMIVIIIAVIVICLVVFSIVRKRKRRLPPETMPGRSFTTKPQPTTVVNIGESSSPIRPLVQTHVPATTTHTKHPTAQPQVTPAVTESKTQHTSSITTPQTQPTSSMETHSVIIPSFAQTPQLPPGQKGTQEKSFTQNEKQPTIRNQDDNTI